MGQKAKTRTVDSRNPKHSDDSSRPSKTPVGKGGKEHRDASTVSLQQPLQQLAANKMLETVVLVYAGAQTEHVQDSR